MENKDKLNNVENFSRIFCQSPIGNVIVGFDKRITSCNRAFSKFIGYDENEIVGKTIAEITHPEDIEVGVNNFKRLIDKEIESITAAKRYISKDGKIVWGEVCICLMSDENNVPLYFLAIVQDITERKRAEEIIKESEESLKRAQSLAKLGSWSWNLSTNIVTWSEELYRINNRNTDLPTPQYSELETFYTAESWKILNNAVENAIKTGESYELELDIVLPDKKIKHTVATGKADYDLRGNIVGLSGTVQDITERKKAEEALKESEHKYRELIELAVDGILIGSHEGIIIGANSYMLKLTGRKLEDIIGKHISILFPPDELNRVPFRFDLLHKGETVISNRNILTSEGGAIPIEMHTKMMEDGTYQSIYHDISERKRTEELLRKSEESYRLITETVNDMISKHKPDGSYSYISPAFTKILGYEPIDLIGVNAYELFHPEDISRITDYHKNLIEVRNAENIIEYRIKHKNGNYVFVETNNSIIWNGKENQIKEIISVTRDITSRKEQEELHRQKEYAEHASRAKSKFLANVSHEIRNPLNALIGTINNLSRTELNEKQNGYIEIMKMSSENLTNIINDVLDFAKIEANKIDVINKDFNLYDLVNESFLQYKPIAEAKKIDFVVNIDNNVNTCFYSDKLKIKQILNNLISNAIKYTIRGKINIDVKQPSSDNNFAVVKFLVSDSGIGIKDCDKNKVFDSFLQLDSSPNKEYQGTGLGLAIAKKLAEMLGGNIAFKSEYMHGSEFTVELKLQISSEANNEIKEKFSHLLNNINKDIRILYAEDDLLNRIYLSDFLREFNFHVDTAINGEEAFEKYIIGKYDIVLMDGQMPKVDGFVAAKNIREFEKQHNSKPIPIIAITGYATLGDKERFIEAGMNNYVTKPIDEEKLIRLISLFCNNS